MIHKKTLLLLALMQAGFAMAGDLLTNTNQSAHFLRNPARDASTEIDAVYTNPAGLVMLGEGFHFSINNQSAFQTRTITSTAPVFFYNGGNTTREFKGTASAPIIPSIQAAYKKGKWVLSGSIAVVGGGGKATFDKGLPSFESLIGNTTAILTGNTGYMAYTDDQYMKGANFIFGGQLGGTYQINKNFSAYAGFRLNVVHNKYEGYLKNFQVTALGSTTNATYTGVYTALAAKSSLTAAEQVALVGSGFAAKASSSTGIQLESTQSGWGVAPIIGFNYNWDDKLNIGAKYEFRTALNVENDTKIDDTGLFADGVNTAYDVPAMLSAGASYKVLPKLTASAGYHHFFDSQAKMENDKQKNAGNTNEYLAGLEYRIDKMFLVSAGGQITDYGVNDAYQRDLSFACSSYSIGLGGAVNISPKVRINVGYFWTTYSDYTKEPGGGISVSGTELAATSKDVFSRTNKVFGAGVDFSF
ncbi:MAG: rane protein involved in aromatic hydrocarbon degradation [Bacteroidetes bacterium]|jgi:long-chain fatty acid transport protein|nr:rane protein involved in aromatic hydrocarbon degradation [Bacteroidota bacterium]